jgi:hypothetical protein
MRVHAPAALFITLCVGFCSCGGNGYGSGNTGNPSSPTSPSTPGANVVTINVVAQRYAVLLT